ncbi:uncharacterized protein DMAD_00613 [Drosophila madeirensis]|uniref:Uncharacterized protein n=1 Tax=Drosophila madeirensis TaxID=30013 RepID=A0AAU9FZ90_DROMD
MEAPTTSQIGQSHKSIGNQDTTRHADNTRAKLKLELQKKLWPKVKPQPDPPISVQAVWGHASWSGLLCQGSSVFRVLTKHYAGHLPSSFSKLITIARSTLSHSQAESESESESD